MATWMHDHFQEITEFAGYTDDCGPCANEVCLSAFNHSAPTTAGMNTIRARDVAAHLFIPGQGQTIANVRDDVRRFAPWVQPILTPDPVGYERPNYDLVRGALDRAMTAQHVAVVNLGAANKLLGNESRVDWHFVAVGGTDHQGNYYVANGDEMPFTGKPRWLPWSNIVAADPVAVLEYAPAPAPLPLPAGWTDTDGVLYSPSGIPVTQGFRAWVLGHTWDSANVPLAAAKNVAITDLTQPAHGGGSIQVFRDCMLGWTEHDGVVASYPLGPQLALARVA